MSTYNSPTDLAPLTKARSVDINTFDAAVAAAFAVLPNENDIYANRVNYGIDNGTTNTYVVTLPVAPTSMFDGMTIMFSPKNQNTGAATLNVGLGVIAVRLRDGSVPRVGDIVVGVPLVARYSVATGFFHIDGNPTIAATGVITSPVSDSTALLRNAGDPSKLLRFDLSAQTTGTTRVITTQDRDMVLGKTFLDRSPRTANAVLTKADQANLIDFTAGGFTQTFSASSVLGRGWWAYLQNSGTGDVEVQAPAAVSTTSVTSNSIAAGTTWTLATGLAIGAGDTIALRRTADPFNQRVTGFVTSYNSGTGAAVVNVIARVGSGTFTDWSVTTCPVAGAIDGLPSYVIYPGEVRMFYVPETGNGLRAIVIKSFYRKATSSYQFICPPGYSIIGWDGVGGAGGAGSGAKGALGASRTGGSPGGTPGRVRRRLITSAVSGLIPGYSYAQTIGAAGTSGAAQATNGTFGLGGTAGGNTSIGSFATAYGGVAGIGGTDQSTGALGSVPGSGSAGTGGAAGFDNTGGVIRPGGAPTYSAMIAGNNGTIPAEEGGGGLISGTPQNAVWGGASSGVNVTSNNAGNPSSASSLMGVASGGWGSSVSSGDGVSTAYPGSISGGWGFNNGAAAGTSGAAPTAGSNGAAPNGDFGMGNPGGGGGSSATANVSGGRGGDGTGPGAPGGGGGACTNGTGSSGAGGTSQPGQSITWGEI